MILVMWATLRVLFALQVIDAAEIHTSEESVCQVAGKGETPCHFSATLHGTLLRAWTIQPQGSDLILEVDDSRYIMVYKPDAYRMEGGTPAVAIVVAIALLLIAIAALPWKKGPKRTGI